jgi:polygalacturonase
MIIRRMICLLLLATAMQMHAQQGGNEYARYYENLPVNLQQAAMPTIPDRTVRLTDFGGGGDGKTLNTEAFRKAIACLAKEGGGRLIVPQGYWKTGPIELDNNIELHLERNAFIVMSEDKRLFIDPANPKGRCLPGIRADECTNIAITGEGIIDGNGGDWRYAKRNKMSDAEWNQLKEKGGMVSNDGKMWYAWKLKNGAPDISDTPERQERRRNDLVRFYKCDRVLLKGVTVENSPRFHVHPFQCTNLIIDSVTVVCPWNAQNGDGIDLSDCQRALIVNATVDVGDDGICLKSSKLKGESIRGVEDVLIQNCYVRHAHGGFVLGSNTAAGMRRIVCRNNTYTQTHTGLRFKSAADRGGRTEQIYVDNILMKDIQTDAIVFQCDYADDGRGKKKNETEEWIPDFHDIHISNVVCDGAQRAIHASGLAGHNCVHDISISGCTFVNILNDNNIDTATTKITIDN